ncbi:MAG: 2-oxoacid:acceptor oxidoreductase subunit alpha [Candidatus Alcyoniella australis]|nr:2-oxoacid:acceptor oxidoreductase subunit alpha [Candidatus Alcyoniella australis]
MSIRATKQIENSPLPGGPAFIQGNEAIADAAVIAGCRFFAGYPITPSSEIMRRMIERFHTLDGRFVQMEDELGSIAAVIGAAWTGAKAMTATSGPGLSLMIENLGYATMTETPLLLVNVQRVGPSTGQATRPAQGDVMQARWGGHGGFPCIALAPSSVQELIDFTIRAFNLAEAFRTPVLLMADEIVGHLRENCVFPEQVEIWQRYYAPGEPPFDTDHPSLVPSMPKFGDGEDLLITGSTHDARGLRMASSAEVQARVSWRLHEKFERGRDEIVRTQHFGEAQPKLLLVSYGGSARAARQALTRLLDQGRDAGLLKLDTLWPFPEQQLQAAAAKADQVLVVEANCGQIVLEVERLLRNGPRVTAHLRHDGEAITPSEVLAAAEAL